MTTTFVYYVERTHDRPFYTRLPFAKKSTTLLRKLGITSVETVCRILEMSQLSPYSIQFRWYFAENQPLYPPGYYYLAKSLLRSGRTAEALQMFAIASSLIRNSLESESDKSMRFLHKIDSIIDGFDRRDPFEVFAKEISHGILNYLSLEDCTQCQIVSKRWYQYCNDDNSLRRSTVDFSDYPEDDVVLFRRRLEHVAKIRPEIAHVHLDGKKPQCLEFLKVANFQIANTRIKKLTLHVEQIICRSYHSSLYYFSYFRNLVVVRELEICVGSFNLCLHSILQNQPVLEVLRLCAAVNFAFMNNIQQFSLKRVQIRTNGQYTRDISIVLLETCPNLEFLEVSYGREIQSGYLLRVELLVRAFYQSKLTFLALCGYRFERQITATVRDPTVTLFWPQNLTSLTIDNSSWRNLRTESGSLQNLKRLKIGGNINVSKFFEKFAIGKSLTLLHLHCKEGDLAVLTPIKIWGKCPLLRFVSFLEFEHEVDKCIKGLIPHCPKLEAIDVIEPHISNTTIVALNNKKGLQRIGFVQCPLDVKPEECEHCLPARNIILTKRAKLRSRTARIESRCTRVAISWEPVVPEINF